MDGRTSKLRRWKDLKENIKRYCFHQKAFLLESKEMKGKERKRGKERETNGF